MQHRPGPGHVAPTPIAQTAHAPGHEGAQPGRRREAVALAAAQDDDLGIQLGQLLERIGLESMDTQAACRTYNILASEGRNVVAALLLE